MSSKPAAASALVKSDSEPTINFSLCVLCNAEELDLDNRVGRGTLIPLSAKSWPSNPHDAKRRANASPRVEQKETYEAT